MVGPARNVVLAIGIAVSLAGCGGSGGGPSPTPVPVAKTFSPTGTLTMTSTADGTGNRYTGTIQLSEHGGLGGSMGNVDFSYNLNGTSYATATFESSQAWAGGTRLNALNNAASNFLTLIDSSPTQIPNTAVATLHYTDDNQQTSTLTLTASIPAPVR